MKKHWQNYVSRTKCVSCNKEFEAYVYNLRRGWGKFCSVSCSKKSNRNRTGKTFTEDQKRRIGESLKRKFASGELVSPLRTLRIIGSTGKKSPNWKGGRSFVGQGFRSSKIYGEWRSEVLRAQDYTCQFCKKRGGKLEVDHVEEFSKSFDKRLDVTNGRVLCTDCHKRVTGYRKTEKTELRGAFVEAIMEMAEKDERIIVITCDVGFKFLDKFKNRFPKRYFNFGTTEMSSMTIAAAMALSGLRPIIYSMVNFMVFRPFEAVRNCVCYHNAPVIIAGVSGSKAYGFLGLSHNFTKNEDINAIWRFPNLRIRLPWTEEETKVAVVGSIKSNSPTYIRL